MRIKALFALLGLGLALMLVAGCSDSNTSAGPVVTGTITNASTGLPQGSATVALLQNGTPVATTQATAAGQFTFTNVAAGSGYTIQVTSNDTPATFPTFTTNAFTVGAGTNTENITVGSGIIGTLGGTVTNASTGLGQANATVTLLQNGNVVATSQTDANGAYSFTSVTPGDNYTLLVTSNDTPPSFTDVTTAAFTVAPGANTQNVTVGSGIAGTTVSGTIGTVEPTATFTVSIMQGTQTLSSTTTGPADIPAFTLTNVPVADGLVIKVVNNMSGIITLFGPLNVPAAGRSGIVVNVKTENQVEADGAPSDASVVAYITGGGTITANGVTSPTIGNPVWLTGLPVGNTSVAVTPVVGTPFTFPVVPISATLPVVIRFNTTN